MYLNLKKETAQAIGLSKFKAFGVSEESWGWRTETVKLVLDTMPAAKVKALEVLLGQHPKAKGVRALLSDLEVWKQLLAGTLPKARTVEQFASLLKAFLQNVPGHRVYDQVDDVDGDDGEAGSAATWLPYYVSRIKYNPPVKRGDDYQPAYVTATLLFERFGGRQSRTLTFMEADCRGKTAAEVLAAEDIMPETPELRAAYVDTLARFNSISQKVGLQFLATGIGTLDVDGNPETDRDSWYRSSRSSIELTRDTGPSRVVLDVFFERGGGRGGREDNQPDPTFWQKAGAAREDDEDEDDVEEPEQLDVIEVPLHPYVVVFDLARHLRTRVHVCQLQDYIYDPQMADKLVLSADRKALVQLLVDMKSGGFQDIVAGKAGGAVVLLAGPPGTGKTLTAEVYAESEGRALYSIQCSQLGIDPGQLEDELMQVFTRARRWNAVILLDEADVYVHARGDDLVQNAIVGVFLRVLEYQDAVLFLTTNRPDDVDDAIASRCIAKLTYPVPTPEQQKTIWRILATSAGAKISDDQIDAVVAANPQLSGRDVKNLLKLSRLLQPDGITAEGIEFVKQFKPTADQAAVPATAMPAGIARCQKCGLLIGKKAHQCRKAGG